MFSAILITGGATAEVFLPATSTSCELPGLVMGRFYHTQDNLLLCGGWNGDNYFYTSCERFIPANGTWIRTNHILQEGRFDHVSWTVEEGTMLMGGANSGTTSEIVKIDGTTERSFDLKYDTGYETFQWMHLLPYFHL